MKHIQRGKLKQVFVKVPSPQIMGEYEKYSDTIRRQILVLSHKIILLTEARDRLLPKLMSGEIEV
jgi:type I restriction enzyme S subunit